MDYLWRWANKRMKVGFLGGAFNPPHKAHILLGETALSYYNLDKLIYIPTHIPPHKVITDGWNEQIRLLLISLAVFAWDAEKVYGYLKKMYLHEGGIKDFLTLYNSLYLKHHKDYVEVSDYEITSNGISYTINTVNSFLAIHPDWEIYIIIGMDQAATLNTWKDYQKLSKLAKFCVAERKAFDSDKVKNDFPFIDIFPFPSINISSSQIRKLFYKGQNIKGLVPDIVLVFLNLLKTSKIKN